MKLLFLKFMKWFGDNSDFIIDTKQILALFAFSLAWLKPILDVFVKYGLQSDYGFFAVFGYFIITLVRYLYPKWFPKQDKMGFITWIIRFVAHSILAFTTGILCTPLVSEKIGEQNLSIVAVSIGLGAFYQLVLVRIIKYIYNKFGITKDEQPPQTFADGEPRPGDPRG